MLDIDYKDCSGCGACVQKCPKKCISWQKGELGFLYPIVDETRCIDCHLCEKVCPIKKELDLPGKQAVFALVHQDKEILSRSTSGGAFTAIAESILRENGVVYGCSMEDDFQVRHIRVTDLAGLSRLRGSKYVQSNTGDTYICAENDLKAGKKVLFSGTPCQIRGLKLFLDRQYDNLITIDIVCHGVGSQAYFDKFMEDLNRRKGRIKEIRFRDKQFVGWSCGGVLIISSTSSQVNEEMPFYNYDNYYYSYFLSGDIYRISCYSCPYANIKRQGDITLGDFWGIESCKLPVDSYDGCSLVIANTEKGNTVISSLKNVQVSKTSAKAAIKHNNQLVAPSTLNPSRKIRVKEFEQMTGKEIQDKYIQENKRNLVIGKLKTMIPYSLKRKLRNYLG